MNRGWTHLANVLCLSHNARGAALVAERERPVTSVREVSTNQLTVVGRSVSAKAVRKWLWDNRAAAVDADCLWSRYYPEQNVSVIGMGSLEG